MLKELYFMKGFLLQTAYLEWIDSSHINFFILVCEHRDFFGVYFLATSSFRVVFLICYNKNF